MVEERMPSIVERLRPEDIVETLKELPRFLTTEIVHPKYGQLWREEFDPKDDWNIQAAALIESLQKTIEELESAKDAARAKIAEAIGELYAAALSDYAAVGYEEIGLHGIPIKVWREAYAEGVKDMAGNVAACFGGDSYKPEVMAAFERHRALLNREQTS